MTNGSDVRALAWPAAETASLPQRVARGESVVADDAARG
jgi:hypothetical protein